MKLPSKKVFRSFCVAIALLTLQTSLSSCFGRFALTRKLYGVNESINDKWLRTIVTFVLVAVPVYEVSAFLDWVLFNTVEFWGGKNPIDGMNSDRPTPVAPPQLQTAGNELRIQLGERVLVMTLHENSAELREGSGALISSLEVDESGERIVRDASGRVVETKSALEIAELMDAARTSRRALVAELERQSGERVARR